MSRTGNNPQHFRRVKYLAANLGGTWTYSPVSRCWVCDDGRWVSRVGHRVGWRGAALDGDGGNFLLHDTLGEALGFADEHMRPPVTLPERRTIMQARDEEALRLYQQGYSYAEIGKKLPRLGPHSEPVGGTVGTVAARRIVQRAMSRG